MSPSKLCLLVILATIATQCFVLSSENVLPNRVWIRTQVPITSLGSPMSTLSVDRMRCAFVANLNPDCYLFCHSEGQCFLHRLKTVAFFEPAAEYGQTITCFTRLSEWPSCSNPFKRLPNLEDLGCLLEDTSPKNWNDAQDSCQTLGGELAVMKETQDFLRLRDHYASQNEVTGLWIGVYNGLWTDGRNPDPEEWFDDEPNGSGLCGDMRLSGNYGGDLNFYLSDNMCSSLHGFLCQAD